MPEKKPAKKWSEMNKGERVGGIIGLAVALIIGIVGIGSVVSAVGSAISSHPTENSTTQSTQQPVTSYKTVTTTVAIPFSKVDQDDATRPLGTSAITTVGIDGSKTQTYKVTYVDGIEKSRDLVSEEVTSQPVSEVTSVGTYVAPMSTVQAGCTNGSYVNSAGNTVCSPEASSSVPAGATAQCSDGTYSFSQSRSGTCSHHGGVAVWL